MLKRLLPVTLLVCTLVACNANNTSNENQTQNQNATPRSKTPEERKKGEKEHAPDIKTLDDAVRIMDVQTVPLIGGGGIRHHALRRLVLEWRERRPSEGSA